MLIGCSEVFGIHLPDPHHRRSAKNAIMYMLQFPTRLYGGRTNVNNFTVSLH
jgi:hypothetical protein